MKSVTEKPLRKDAERNRQLILRAAEDLFAERGLDVTLNEIARHAGVGVGTVYRRFPDRTLLLEELCERKLAQLVELMREAVADPDPWHGLTSFLERALELQAMNVVLKDLLLGTPAGLDRIAQTRAQLFPLGTELIRRAQASGQLRRDAQPQDLPMIQLALSGVIEGTREVRPELWRRYLQIIIQGLRADPTPPEPIEIEPVGPEAIDTILRTSSRPRS